MPEVRKPFPDKSNAAVLNKVRSYATDPSSPFFDAGYARRVPNADQSNIREVARTVESFKPNFNTFYNILVNAIAYELILFNLFDNPLAQFKYPGLVPDGTDVREMGVQLIKAREYDKFYTNVFKTHDIPLLQMWHHQNRRNVYNFTVNEPEARQALYGQGNSLAQFINMLMQSPVISDQQDEYNIMRGTLNEKDLAHPIYNIHVDVDLNDPTIPHADAREAGLQYSRIVSMMSDYMGYPEHAAAFNYARNPLPVNNPVAFVTPGVKAVLGNDVLANVFHADYVLNPDSVISLDYFGLHDDKTAKPQIIFGDSRLFGGVDTVRQMEMIRNPETMSDQFAWHRQGTYFCSDMVPVVMLSFRESTRDSLTLGTISAVTVALPEGVAGPFMPGLIVPLIGTVTADGGIFNDALHWSLSKDDGEIGSNYTFIDGDGLLHLGADETRTSVTVRADSIQSPSIYGELTLTIGDPSAPAEPLAEKK